MANLNGFNANDVAPSAPRTPLPKGSYKAVIVDTEEKPTKSGNGSYIQFTFEVIEGQHQGRKCWARLNLNNPSDQAVSIARAELSAICRAVNVMTPRDTQDLHDIPLVIDVVEKVNKENGEVNNEIKGYSSVNQPQQQRQPVATASGGKPWQRK